jgi:hypothetical protein
MRMAKAPQEHINCLMHWMKFNDELCTIDPTNKNEWKSFKSDWEGDEKFMGIIEHCEDTDKFSWEYYMDYYQKNISHIHMRIVFGYEVLVENVCDMELDYLDFNKELKKLMEDSKNTI